MKKLFFVSFRRKLRSLGNYWAERSWYTLECVSILLPHEDHADVESSTISFQFFIILINCLIALWRFGLIIAIPNSCNLQDLINGRKKQHLHYDFCQQLFNVCGHLKTFKTIYPIFWITFTLCLKMENWHHGLASTKPRNWCCCWLSWQGELGHCRDAQIIQMVVLRLYVEFSRAS